MFKMMRRWLTYVLFTGCLLIILVVLIFNPDTQRQTKLTLSDWDEFASQLAQLNNINDFKQILKPILVERVVGTPNHELVKDYIANELRKLNWNVELDSFKDVTPNKGTLEFTNIIATSDSSVSRHLVLACHYDSKLMKFVFIAATDSAPIGLKLIFFDGEEAFVSWTAKDSVYGARHLASLMEARSSINQIELLVLLDLIGDSSPQFYSYFANTHHWYKSLVNIERRLKTRNLLESEKSTKYYFVNNKFFGAGIQDDHEPFLIRGVPVLHIIPFPFPGVWHTEFDNESGINYKTVKNLMLIFELFIMQYLSESK